MDINKPGDVQAALDAYLKCAIWTSVGVDDEGELAPLDTLGDFDADDLDPVAEIKLADEFDDFCMAVAAGGLASEWEPAQFGHDFWLTRNGHGTGFWDRGMAGGDRLTELAEAYGETSLYVGDDGKLYVE